MEQSHEDGESVSVVVALNLGRRKSQSIRTKRKLFYFDFSLPSRYKILCIENVIRFLHCWVPGLICYRIKVLPASTHPHFGLQVPETSTYAFFTHSEISLSQHKKALLGGKYSYLFRFRCISNDLLTLDIFLIVTSTLTGSEMRVVMKSGGGSFLLQNHEKRWE